MDTRDLMLQNKKVMKAIADKNEHQHKKDNPVIEIQKTLEFQIRQFENEIDNEQEVLIMAASFGSTVIFTVHTIEFSRPNVIIFHGETVDGGKIRLIQHSNQLNFLLQSTKRDTPEEPRQPIGFIHN